MTEDDIANFAYNGSKHNRELLLAMARIWQLDSEITVAEVLDMLRDEYPAINDMPEAYMAQLASKLQLRPRVGSHTKFNSEMIAHLKQLLCEFPTIKPAKMNESIRKKFPNRPQVNDECINQIIRRHNLRPLRGIDIDGNVDRETVEAIVDMFGDDPHLILKNVQKMLKQRFPLKKTLDLQTIDEIVKVNFCRIKTEETNYRGDEEIVEKIREIITDEKSVKVKSIRDRLNVCSTTKTELTSEYVRYMVKKFDLRSKYGPMKLDDQMRSAVYNLHLDNTTYSAVKINHQLRILMPEKPHVSSQLVSNAIRDFRLANHSVP